ncbi:hypothetical protein RI129_008042 [Pyrocoelia pectoralis]|uniref:Uncharacterized protein n=1 Tax=Pyrocoelia pectoralis TaxID=417401 RepID=A0AAN7ZJ03_9COLE
MSKYMSLLFKLKAICFRTVTNYTPNNDLLAQTSDEQSCAESTTSNHSNYVEEENPSAECSTSSCTESTDRTPSRKVPKRRALEEINAHFMEAATSFRDMCSTVKNTKHQPTEDELFGQRVVAFIASITHEDAKNDAKAAVMKYLADCVSAQYD